AFVQALASVFLKMYARDTNSFLSGRRRNLNVSVFRQWLVILRNLIALWKVRIKIIFARKDGGLANLAIQRHRSQSGKFDRLAIQDGQCCRKPEAYRANVWIGRIAEVGGARAEDLRRRQQLDVDMEPDQRLICRPR